MRTTLEKIRIAVKRIDGHGRHARHRAWQFVRSPVSDGATVICRCGHLTVVTAEAVQNVHDRKWHQRGRADLRGRRLLLKLRAMGSP